MREIDVKEIKNAVKELCISANKVLPNDLESCIKNCVHNEIEELPKSIMQDISNI